MTKLQRQVLEFHRVFDHPIADSPTIPADDRVRFRAAFIVEECLEFLEACFDMNNAALFDDVKNSLKIVLAKATVKVDLALAVDALADIDYVVEGCRLEFGVNGEPIADEVHRSNMAKKGASKTPEGKTLKPPGWTPPDIAGELEKQRGVNALKTVIACDPGCDQIRATYDSLKARVRSLPPMTDTQRAEQRLDFAYGNLAIDGKASRTAFKILATTTVDGGLGWTPEQFEAWAADKKWDAP
jgi:predicted HAD superfamily Cof-like phosphohydrolase